MNNITEERLQLIHKRLGPWHGLRIETAGVNGSCEQIRFIVHWKYTITLKGGTMRRHETLEEMKCDGYTLFEALGKVMSEINRLEADLAAGVLFPNKE